MSEQQSMFADGVGEGPPASRLTQVRRLAALVQRCADLDYDTAHPWDAFDRDLSKALHSAKELALTGLVGAIQQWQDPSNGFEPCMFACLGSVNEALNAEERKLI